MRNKKDLGTDAEIEELKNLIDNFSVSYKQELSRQAWITSRITRWGENGQLTVEEPLYSERKDEISRGAIYGFIKSQYWYPDSIRGKIVKMVEALALRDWYPYDIKIISQEESSCYTSEEMEDKFEREHWRY